MHGWPDSQDRYICLYIHVSFKKVKNGLAMARPVRLVPTALLETPLFDAAAHKQATGVLASMLNMLGTAHHQHSELILVTQNTQAKIYMHTTLWPRFLLIWVIRVKWLITRIPR